MVEKAEGIIVPGTTHPLQAFVVDSREIKEGEIYKLGLRSAYDLDRSRWIVHPERDRAIDVSKIYPEKLAWAKMVEDKVRILLRYDKAALKVYWDFIHRQRMLSQRRGEGDFSDWNIAYKQLSNSGLFQYIEEATGEHIASVHD
jgi:hypothetical protein